MERGQIFAEKMIEETGGTRVSAWTGPASYPPAGYITPRIK